MHSSSQEGKSLFFSWYLNLKLTFPNKGWIWSCLFKINDHATLNLLDQRLQTLVQHPLSPHTVRSAWEKPVSTIKWCCITTSWFIDHRLSTSHTFLCSVILLLSLVVCIKIKKTPNLLWLHTFGWWQNHLWGRCQAAHCLVLLLLAISAPMQRGAGPSERALWLTHCQLRENSGAGAAGQTA